MNNGEKLNIYNNFTENLKQVARKSIGLGKYEKAMAALSACADIMYRMNQVYMDTDLEDMTKLLASKILNNYSNYEPKSNMVIFYDGFGLDLRGLAITMTRAIAESGYHLIYVTTKKAVDNIPHIVKELAPYHAELVYIDMDNYKKQVYELNNVFLKYCPRVAFFYTTPDDIAGTVVFNAYDNKVIRIQVDLTDHAFWLGARSVDYIMECRDIGVSNAIYHRRFRPEQIIMLDMLSYVNKDHYNEPDVFDIHSTKYIFSGGALYKTLGDDNLYYYKAIEHILDKFSDIKFLYAGSGDTSQMKTLQQKFPGRVYLIAERPDFQRYIDNCIFYLNTYPMFGGMMMRYAAMAGKLPITLRHDNDADGILNNQSEMGIEFDSFIEFVNEIDKVITDEKYRKFKEAKIKNAVMNELTYQRNIDSIIRDCKSEFNLEIPREIDTTQFRKEYVTRFDYNKDVISVIANNKNISLIFDYFDCFAMKMINKLLGRLKRA